MIKLFFILISIFFEFSTEINKFELKEFSRMDLIKLDNEKQKVFLIYLNTTKFYHKNLMKEINEYLHSNQIKDYNYGFLDVNKNKKLIEFFKIRKFENPGIILYNFKTKDFYILENLKNINELMDLTQKVINNDLNWSGTNLVENLIFKITGKRLGKKAQIITFVIITLFGLIFSAISKKIIGDFEEENNCKKTKSN